MRRLTIALAALLLGCGDQTGPNVSLSGCWSELGPLGGLYMEIAESGEKLTGKAAQINDGEGLSRYDLSLSGRRGDRNFSVTIEDLGGLAGTILDDTHFEARFVPPGGRPAPSPWLFHRISCQPQLH